MHPKKKKLKTATSNLAVKRIGAYNQKKRLDQSKLKALK